MRPIGVLWSITAWLSALWLACGCDDSGTSTPALEGRVFLFESAEGFEPVADTTVRLSFEDDVLSFSADCNGHSGAYELHDGRLMIAGLASTAIGCGAALLAQDMWLAEFFSSSPLLELDGDRLTLTGAQATLVFLDRETADPDRPLAGTPWTIDTFIDHGAASNLPLASEPTLLFGDDGNVQIDTGCNTGSGRYAVAGSQLTLTDVAYTERACSGTSASAEAHIQAVMRAGVLSFEIEAARLTLERNDLGVSANGP